MRTLVIYSNNNGDSLCTMVQHDDDFDTSDKETIDTLIENLNDELKADVNPMTLRLIEMPTDKQFRPAVVDDWGDEIAMSFLDI
jgi:hypothetical protein